MTLDIPEIKTLAVEISEIKKVIENISKPNLTAEWYNDEQCWQLKGGFALNTYRTNRFYQCKGGIPDGYVGGRKVWSRESVLEWLPLTDEQLVAYHAKYKTGAQKKI